MFIELEIEVDGIFKTMLLLKKKKYAALMVHKKPDSQEYTLERQVKGKESLGVC